MTNKSRQLGVVVGIDKYKDTKVTQYRVIIATVSPKADKQYNWQFNCLMMSEEDIIKTFNTGAKWLNIKLEKGKIKGSAGALSRFETQDKKPLVVISQLVDSADKVIGFKVASYDGKVKNIAIKELIAYGNRVTKAGAVPIQNAIFVPDDNNKKAHYKAYPENQFITELIPTTTNKNVVKPSRVPVQKNEKTLNKLEEIYTAEQIAELREGKKNGVDIRIYANPALSAEQMQALRKGLQKGVNVKPFASPDYSPQLMKWYTNDSKAGIDIRRYLNPKYSIEQLSEISIAAEEGLDLSKLSDIKLSPNDMAEIRERLEHKIFKEELVKKDGSWA